MNNSNIKLNDTDILIDVFDGVIPNKKYVIKIYCRYLNQGQQAKQQILENQEIVQRLKHQIELRSGLRKSKKHRAEKPVCNTCDEYDLLKSILENDYD